MALHTRRTDPAIRTRRPGRRLIAVWIAVLLPAVILGVPAASYTRALTAPGSPDWQATTVEWVRDHGGGPVVDIVENWWYAHNRPSGDTPAPGSVPTAVAAPQPLSPPEPRRVRPPSLPLLPGVPPLANEAAWVPDAGGAGTHPGLYTGFFRPDAAFPAQIVGVAWMDQDVVAAHLFAGTAEPVPGTAPARAQVPNGLRGALVAVFNSGWKMRDSRGGFYTAGRPVVPLKDGPASLVIDTSGRVTVGRWGQDVQMSPRVEAVRQNLDLIVDDGQPVAGLADNADGSWGSPKNQFQYTWRSGLGTDRSGNLLYVAGDKLTLAGLASAMAEAGAHRGMELDIHPKTVSFNVYRPGGGASGPTKLLPGMVSPATRYLVPDHRDFLAVTLRGATP